MNHVEVNYFACMLNSPWLDDLDAIITVDSRMIYSIDIRMRSIVHYLVHITVICTLLICGTNIANRPF